jgi:hypothetical protein
MIFGIKCALNIPMHEQYLFGSLDQNNLAHVGKAMQTFPSLKKYVMDPMYLWDNIYDVLPSS